MIGGNQDSKGLDLLTQTLEAFWRAAVIDNQFAFVKDSLETEVWNVISVHWGLYLRKLS